MIGAGPIGSEMAQAFARLGSKVSIVGHTSDHILPREDRDAAEIVQNAFVNEGIELFLPAKNLRITLKNGEKILSFEHRDTVIEIVVDEILVGIGRAPNVEGLNLEAAGIAFDPRKGVQVNDRLQTTNPAVYAAGDICFPYKFTHTADALARILIANALFMGRQKTSALTIPWCTYTDPEVAHVGMYEQDATKKGIEVVTLTVPLSDIDRAVLDGESEGFARVHLRKGSDRILGATIVARHAGEMINEFSLAITNGLGLSAIGRTIHPYPTQAEVIKTPGRRLQPDAADTVCQKGVVGVAEMAERLTMNSKKIILVLAGIVGIALFFWFDLQRFLTLDALKANRQSLLEFYADHRLLMVAGFMAVYIVQTALSLPGAAILSLAAGAIFGTVMGTVYANLAATIGATLAFLVTRYLLQGYGVEQIRSKAGRNEPGVGGARLQLSALSAPGTGVSVLPDQSGRRFDPASAPDIFLRYDAWHHSGRLCLCQCRCQPGHH